MLAALIAALATVFSTNNSSSYACSGGTGPYTVQFPYGATSDLTVTSTTAGGVVTTLVLTTDFTLTSVSTQTTANLTLTAGSKCPSGSTLKIARTTPLTQPTSLRTQGPYNPATHEAGWDRMTRQLQDVNSKIANPVLPSTLANSTPITATGSSTSIQLQQWFAFAPNAKAYGCTGDGVANDTSCLQSLFNAGSNTVIVPAGSYLVTAGSLTIPANVKVHGYGKEVTTIKTTGAGYVVKMLNVSNAGLYDLTLDIGLNAAAIGLHVQATGASSAFRNLVSGVRFYSPASPTVAGQIGVYVETAGSPNGAWFNDFSQIHIQGIARPIVLSAIANQNRFSNVGIEQFGTPAGTGYGIESLGDNNVFSGFTFSKGGSSSTTLYGCRFGPTTGGYNVVTSTTADIGTVGSICKFEAGAGVLNNVVIGSDSSSGSSATYDAAASSSNIAWPGPGGALSVPKIRPQVGNLTLDAAGGSVVSAAGMNLTSGSLFIGTGRGITYLERVTGTYDPPSLATGTQTTNVQGITGVALGDHCTPSFSLDLQGMQLTAYVSSTNNVTVVLRNGTAGTIDLASGTLKVVCMRTN